MTFQHTGNCPRCGAPIFAKQEPIDSRPGAVIEDSAPAAHFTCECRHTLPKIHEGELDQPKSVREADKGYADKMRDDARGSRSER
mgnify:CR=1 FL=1